MHRSIHARHFGKDRRSEERPVQPSIRREDVELRLGVVCAHVRERGPAAPHAGLGWVRRAEIVRGKSENVHFW